MPRISLFHIDKKASGSLNSRLREVIVNAILNGYLQPDGALPSSRRLAKQPGIARNTVIHACESLPGDAGRVYPIRSRLLPGSRIWTGDAGVLIERVRAFLMNRPIFNNHFRLGFSSITADRIVQGVTRLAMIFDTMNSDMKRGIR